MTQSPPPPPIPSSCGGCGAPIDGMLCLYCGRSRRPARRVVHGVGNHYPRLEDVELRGHQNRVGVAVRCLIVGHQNTIYTACLQTQVRGHQNRVVNVVANPDAKEGGGDSLIWLFVAAAVVVVVGLALVMLG